MRALPPVRRVVTGHDANGLAVVHSDTEFTVEPIAIGGADFALMWTTATVPVDNNDKTDQINDSVHHTSPWFANLRDNSTGSHMVPIDNYFSRSNGGGHVAYKETKQ